MTIPETNVKDFADIYFGVFKNRARPDTGDRGPAYRHVIGIPDGINSPLMDDIRVSADKIGVDLKEGHGNDPDNLRDHSVWVIDSTDFEFNQAELFHQFHDGFAYGENYALEYNELQDAKFKDGTLHQTLCEQALPLFQQWTDGTQKFLKKLAQIFGY